jgi:hypothetical protein
MGDSAGELDPPWLQVLLEREDRRACDVAGDGALDAVAARASGSVAATWSESSPSASAAARAASRAPSART